MKHFYLFFQKAIILVLSLLFFSAKSQPVIGYTSVVSGFTNPVDVVAEPGTNRMFVVQQNGAIRIVSENSILADPYLNINSLVNLSDDERGLLSMAFHPDYINNGYIFVYYTNLSGDVTLARYKRDTESADSANFLSGTVLLTIPHPVSNHNGGKLNFGPDGYLYFAVGDGGGSNDPEDDAQDNTSLLGKMLRLNVDNFTVSPFYSVPSDNPFVGSSPIDDKIWALGLRNPWRWSFDRNNGDMWIADVGQGALEEVNHVTSTVSATGLNYGWRCREGNATNPAYPGCIPSGGGTLQEPIFVYGHNNATGGFAITGGYVYRGTAFPELNGYYVTADYISGNLWLIKPDGTFILQDNLEAGISSFGEDNNGELYALSRTAGTLYNVVVTTVLPVKLISFTGKSFPGYNELKWTTASEENTQKFIIEYSINESNYLVAGEVASTLNSNGSSYSFKHYITNNGAIKYRLRILDIDQSDKYSPVIAISSSINKEVKIYPTVITNNLLQVVSGFEINRMDIFTPNGKQVFTKTMNRSSGYFNLPIPVLQKGMYLIRLTGNDFQKVEKVFIQ